MSKKAGHLKGFLVVRGYVYIKVNMDRFNKQIQEAQYELDGNVMNSMVPFMPMITGNFVNVTKAASSAIQGTGMVYAAYGPQSQFLYEGKGMVDELTGSPWARKGAKKVLVSEYAGRTAAKENLTYTKTSHPDAQSYWFNAAKKKDGKKWIEQVKAIAGGGNNH